jgi:hypothetical protein
MAERQSSHWPLRNRFSFWLILGLAGCGGSNESPNPVAAPSPASTRPPVQLKVMT